MRCPAPLPRPASALRPAATGRRATAQGRAPTMRRSWMQSSRANELSTDAQPASEDQAPERDLEAELAQMEDRYKRALADLDNYRKRSAREAERRITDSVDRQLREWLEVVDSIERALLMEPEHPVVEGLRAVLEQMDSILGRQGVQRTGAPGERFDPER